MSLPSPVHTGMHVAATFSAIVRSETTVVVIYEDRVVFHCYQLLTDWFARKNLR